MVSFLKENGYPITIHLNTNEFEDMAEPFSGYLTIVSNESGEEISQFRHVDIRARIHWANGFFSALRMQEK